MTWSLFAVGAVVLLTSCTSSYPYLVATNNCNCEQFTYKDEWGRFEIDLSARYKVKDRIISTIEMVFRNRSRVPISLRQAYIKGTSVNVKYPFNDRFQPMPFVSIPAGGIYSMTLEGSDTQASDNPWLKIAGENVVLEIRGMLVGETAVPPILLTLVPHNPKIAS